jgi:pyruvate dehydrogenase E2 component (dihydrolipoamide acetyltransferase)
MAFEFKLPDIGEGVVEGEIVKWLVKPGDAIEVDQPMVEVMTDKATVVIPSPKKGVIKEVRGAEGAMVEVHSVLVVIDEGGGGSAPAPKPVAAAPAPKPTAAAPKPVAAAAAPKPVAAAAPAPKPVAVAAPAPAPKAVASQPSAPAHTNGGHAVLAAPATRRLARELGIDLGSIAGTGPAGRVTSDDVRQASSATATPQAIATVPTLLPTQTPAVRSQAPRPANLALIEPSDERIPVRGLRRRIWESMTTSAFTAAHFTFVEECDGTDLVKLRERFNHRLEKTEDKFSYLPFIVKAVIAALKKFPNLNAHVDDDAMEFVKRSNFHIGIAVASERGLVVPVVRHADRRSLLDLSKEIKRLADAVRNNSLTTDDLGGSTFTITSLGKDGGLFATPIINYPEVAIMGVHKMVKRPIVKEDQIVVREMMNLSLSFDHRLIDGHVGAAFTYAVIRLLESPDQLMMEML